MELSTDLVRTFVAVSELGGFSKAAKKLYKSQAAVTVQISGLEERAGLKFFDRSERPAKLTEAGRIFFNFSLGFLNRLEELDRLMKELASGVMGDIKIAAVPSVGTYLLPQLLAEILKNSAKLKITMSVQRRRQVCESVQRADDDFGIILTDKPPIGLVSKPLRKEPLCFIVSRGHPLAKKKIVSLKDLRGAPFIVEAKGSESDGMINRMLAKNGISDFFVRLAVNSYEATKEAVRAGLGVAVLPQFTVKADLRDTLCTLNVAKIRLDGTIMLIQRNQQLHSPAVTAVKNFLVANISGQSEIRGALNDSLR
jgi:DNA-binding transcriptional LysR family regulator